jgi:curved DNA-binding protein CbpA
VPRTLRIRRGAQVLGVPKSSDLARIKQAYLRKAAFWHPDRNAHTPALAKRKFEEVSEALQVLSHEETRRLFDAGNLDRPLLRKLAGAAESQSKDSRAGY